MTVLMCHFRHCNQAKEIETVISDASETPLNKHIYGELGLSRETIHMARQAPLTNIHAEVFHPMQPACIPSFP